MASPSPYAQAVSRRVRQLMAGDKITRQQISDTIGVGVGQVSRRLNGHDEFSLTELEALAPLFGLTVLELVTVEL